MLIFPPKLPKSTFHEKHAIQHPAPARPFWWPALAGAMFASLFPVRAQAQQIVGPTFSGSFQTGLAETFQLTLGSTFTETPAWQNSVTLNWHNVLRRGDRVVLKGWNNSGVRNPSADWLAGLSYRPTPVSVQQRQEHVFLWHRFSALAVSVRET